MKTRTPITTISILSLSGTGLSYAGVEKEADAACCKTVVDEHKHHGAEMQGPGVHTSHSIFNVESTWKNQGGQHACLSQIGERTQVVAIFYPTLKY